MLYEKIPIHSIFPENTKNSILQKIPSTDTEPEVDVGNNKKQTEFIYSKNQAPQKNQEKNHLQCSKKERNFFSEFLRGIPSYEYDEKQIRRNQIKNKSKKNKVTEKVELKNNRFFNYYEGFLSIAEHCHKNQISFTRDKCKEYLKESYIIDFSRDCFIPATTNLTKKQFNKYYRYAQREMKHL